MTNRQSPPLSLKATPFALIPDTPPVWVPGYQSVLARGEITLLGADGGSGKGYYAIDVASELSRAGLDTLWLETEDSGGILTGRITQQRGGLDRIFRVTADVGTFVIGESFWKEMSRLVKSRPHPGLIVLSPLNGFIPQTVNTSRDNDLRTVVFEPLKRFLDSHGLAAIAIVHFNKGSGSLVQRVLGSMAYFNASRIALAAFVTSSGPDKPTEGIIGGYKNNLGPVAPTLAYRIDSTGFHREGRSDVTVVEYYDQLLATMMGRGRPSKLPEAVRLILTELLRGSSAGVSRDDLLAKAAEKGIGRTVVYKARKEFLPMLEQHTAPGQPTLWVLPGLGDPGNKRINGRRTANGLQEPQADHPSVKSSFVNSLKASMDEADGKPGVELGGVENKRTGVKGPPWPVYADRAMDPEGVRWLIASLLPQDVASLRAEHPTWPWPERGN
jgi:AAA domain-containing protein